MNAIEGYEPAALEQIAAKVAAIIKDTGDYFWSVEVLMELTGCTDRMQLIAACGLLVQQGRINAVTRRA